jgi:hypothetical protein
LLKLALKHYGEGLPARLKISDETLVSWLEERAEIPDKKMLGVIDLLDTKGALGEDL